MNAAEILTLLQVLASTIPSFTAIWEKISANSNGTVRPLADILAESDTDFDAVIATAKKELGIS